MIQSISVIVSDENAKRAVPLLNSKSFLFEDDYECERKELWKDLLGMAGSSTNQMPRETLPH